MERVKVKEIFRNKEEYLGKEINGERHEKKRASE